MKKYIIAAVAAIASSPSFAIDWGAPVTDERGRPIVMCPDQEKDCGETATAGRLVSVALDITKPGEQFPAGQEFAIKLKRGLLAEKIRKDSAYVPTAEEIVEIKSAITRYEPVIIYQLSKLIDPASVK